MAYYALVSQALVHHRPLRMRTHHSTPQGTPQERAQRAAAAKRIQETWCQPDRPKSPRLKNEPPATNFTRNVGTVIDASYDRYPRPHVTHHCGTLRDPTSHSKTYSELSRGSSCCRATWPLQDAAPFRGERLLGVYEHHAKVCTEQRVCRHCARAANHTRPFGQTWRNPITHKLWTSRLHAGQELNDRFYWSHVATGHVGTRSETALPSSQHSESPTRNGSAS